MGNSRRKRHDSESGLEKSHKSKRKHRKRSRGRSRTRRTPSHNRGSRRNRSYSRHGMRYSCSSSDSDSSDRYQHKSKKAKRHVSKRRSRIPERTTTPPLPVQQVSVQGGNLTVDNQLQNMHSNFWAQNNFPVSFSVVPEFDPSDNSQTIESWINKVNECAQIYSWNDRQICHYSLPKLMGLAKKWYQGLPSVLFTWDQWTVKLKQAFPSNENYGDLLSSMLRLRCKFGQPLENYYYDKMALINKCEITGSKAVGCLIHGIDDKFVRMGAGACMFSEPEQVLNYLRTVSQHETSTTQNIRGRGYQARQFNKVNAEPMKSGPEARQQQLRCFNCSELGHISLKCNKPLKRCNLCFKLGHDTKDCRQKTSNQGAVKTSDQDANSTKTVMCINAPGSDNDKYIKQVKVNDVEMQGYIDCGSKVTLIRESDAKQFTCDWVANGMPMLQGFGNSTVEPIGKLSARIEIDNVRAILVMYVVPDEFLKNPVLIGQTFTEKPNVILHKTCEDLIFIQAPDFDNEQTKIGLTIGGNQEVLSLTTTPITVNAEQGYNGGLYIQYSHRIIKGHEFLVLPGVYNFDNGIGYVMVTNLTDNTLFLQNSDLLTRGYKYYEAEINQPVMVNDNQTYEPLPVDQVKVGIELTEDYANKFHGLLKKYRDCFALNLQELGKTNLTKMHITLTDDIPVVHNPYRMSHSERDHLNEIVDDLLMNGLIRGSTSSYSSPVILVKKKSGDRRLCIDYRALNRKTIKDKYPLPRIEDQLDSLGGSALFTSLDLASGYYQVPLDEASKHLTAFVTPDGLFEFNRMPFGLANAPSVFQRTINTMLKGCDKDLALAYMDDLLVTCSTISEGLEKLEKVFQMLRAARLTLNLKKCSFFQTRIDYLGYEISANGIQPGRCKIEAVEKFPVPKNIHEVRQFIGLTSYFRRFIKNFSVIAKPLTILTKKDTVWCFGEAQLNAFNELKQKLISRPVLTLYNPNAELEIHTDASKVGIGAILLQKDEHEKLQPIAYFSRQTTTDESKLHSYELETLAVVSALDRFRVYVLGKTFKVVTDCAAIRSTMTKRDLIPRVARWYILMQEYDFVVEHRNGNRMGHVDALSRNPAMLPPQQDFKELVDILTIEDVGGESWLQTVQEQDSETQRVISVLNDSTTKNIVEIHKNYTIKNGRLYRIIEKNGEINLRWVVPKSVRWQIVRMNHDDAGHFGFDKTYSKISQVYWFNKMRRFIKKYCQSCLNCAHNKLPAGPKEAVLHPIPKADKPFDTLHTDHCGPFPVSKKKNCHILCIIDAFTKFIYIKPVKNLRSSTTVNTFREYFSIFGTPRRIISDRGTSFTSKEFAEFIKEKGIKHVLNSVATPRANGQIERYNRTIVDALTATNHGKPENEWDLAIPDVQWAINNTMNKTTGHTPSETLFGIQPTGVSDSVMNSLVSEVHQSHDINELRDKIASRIDKDQQKQKERFDSAHKKPTQYKVGELVRIEKDIRTEPGHSRKLLPKCSGPFRITKLLGNDRYEVEDTPLTRKEGSKTYRSTYAADKLHPWLVFSHDVMSSDSE